MATRKANKLKRLKLDELSLVDSPANKSATVSIHKRDVSGNERERLADQGKAMPDGSYPIANTVDLKNAIQAYGRAKDPDAVKRHIISRARALGAVGSLPDGWSVRKITKENAMDVLEQIKKMQEQLGTITKSLETATKDGKNDDTTAALKKSVDDLTSGLDALKAEHAEAIAKAGMSDDEKAFMKSLAKEDATKFMNMDGKSRKEYMSKVNKSDETLKVGDHVIRKSAVGDDAFVAMQAMHGIIEKQADDLKTSKEEIAKRDEELKTQDLRKRAETEFANLPGTVDEKVAVLKSIEALPEGERKAATAMLMVGEKLTKSAFTRVGHGDGQPVSEDSNLGKIEKIAKSKQAADPKLTYAQAYTAAMEENPALYDAEFGDK